MNSSGKQSNLFKSAIFQKSNNSREEKENFYNTNLLFNRTKDIICSNCSSNYYNKAIMIGQKKLFHD